MSNDANIYGYENGSHKKANFARWKAHGWIPLWKAVFLANNLEPDEQLMRREADSYGFNFIVGFGSGLQVLQDQLDAAMSCLGTEGGLRRKNHVGIAVPKDVGKEVDLKEFGAWASANGYQLPKNFPTTSPLRQEGWIEVSIPYITKQLEYCIEALRDADSKNINNVKGLIGCLEEAFKRHEYPLSAGMKQQLAQVIRPDEEKERDLRSSKNRSR